MEYQIIGKNYLVAAGFIEVKVYANTTNSQICEIVRSSRINRKGARTLAQFLTDFADGKLKLNN